MIRWVLVGFVVIGIALGPVTACATETPMTDAQMACCIAMGHDCGAASQKEDCCPTDTQSAQYFITIKSASSPAPATSQLAWTPAAALAWTVLRFEGRALALKGPPPRARTVPTYLRLSSLLI